MRCYQCYVGNYKQPLSEYYSSRFELHVHVCVVVTKQGVAFYSSTGCVLTGDSQPMDVCSVHRNDIFLRYSVSLLGYGFYGDVLTDSERKRWLGPARYDLSGMRLSFSKLE